VHQGIRASDAGAATFVLVGRVEQMDAHPSAELGKNMLKASYCREDGEVVGGFRRRVRQESRSLFPEIWRPVRRVAMIARRTTRNGPVAKSLRAPPGGRGFSFLFLGKRIRLRTSARSESEKNPYVAGP